MFEKTKSLNTPARGPFSFANVHFSGLREVALGCCRFNGLRARFFAFAAGWPGPSAGRFGKVK
jgi:hypothetical protein